MAAAAAAAAVETRPLPQVGSLGIAARAQPRPTSSPFQSRPQTRLLPSLRRGPRRGREPDADREATPPQGLARAPPPPSKDTPQSRGGAGCRGVPRLLERKNLSVVAASLPVASPRWPPCGSLELLKSKVVPAAGNPGVPFVCQLKLEAGTVGKHPPALKHSAPSLLRLGRSSPSSLSSATVVDAIPQPRPEPSSF